MTTARIIRTRVRPAAPRPLTGADFGPPPQNPDEKLRTSFEINFKLEVAGPGITESEAGRYVKELLRYASAAHTFQVPHPTGERDIHGREEHSRWGGADKVKVS